MDPCQVDPAPIYEEAKAIDGDNKPGTSLYSVVFAAQHLQLISITDRHIMRELHNLDDVLQALHVHQVVLGGFHIDESWMHTRKDGWIPDGQYRDAGGHALALFRYAPQAEGVCILNTNFNSGTNTGGRST